MSASACNSGGNAKGGTGGTLDVLAEVASGAQYLLHDSSAAEEGCSAAIAAWHSGVIAADVDIDSDIVGIAVDACGAVQASADIASCCNSRNVVSSNTITERWRRERGISGVYG